MNVLKVSFSLFSRIVLTFLVFDPIFFEQKNYDLSFFVEMEDHLGN